MIQTFEKKIRIHEGMYRNIQGNPEEEIKSLYFRREETFYPSILKERKNSDTTITVPIDRAL